MKIITLKLSNIIIDIISFLILVKFDNVYGFGVNYCKHHKLDAITNR